MSCKNFKVSKKRPTKNTLTYRDLSSIAKNPCCQHVTLLIDQIRKVIHERETFHRKYLEERNVVNRLAKIK